MDLSRQEYPALLTALQPGQAVSVLNDRVATIGKINSDIADWLSERRRVEETYAQGLRKLAGKRQEIVPVLGVFQAPWQSIIASCESLADSHKTLAQRLEADVERPLRDYQTRSREMQGMTTIQGNLSSLAREFEEAQKRTEKVKTKSGRASTGKLSEAMSGVQDASQQWESQAPYVFEQLQALDENRVNFLRDALTQLQTHEVDQLERSRVTAESTLNVLLNVDTAEEVSTFVARTSGTAPALTSARRNSRPATSHTTSTVQPPSTPAPTTPIPTNPDAGSLAPPTPSIDDRRSEVSSLSGGFRSPAPTTPRPEIEKPKKSAFGGLRRLGTVMGRRSTKDSQDLSKVASPEKRARPSRNPLRRGSSARDMQQIPSPNASMTELADTSSRQQTPGPEVQGRSRTMQLSPAEAAQPKLDTSESRDDSSNQVSPTTTTSRLANGNQGGPPPPQERKPRPPSTIQEEGERDFSVPSGSSAIDDITRAQQEAAATDGEQPQFKLDIRNEPIREEDSDAQNALSNVANTLRMQAQPPQRKQGTVRGRRDVRNTIFVPNPTPSEPTQITENGLLASPTSLTTRPMTIAEDRTADTQSIRSSHSLNSLTPGTVKHAEMHQPGLNASIIETVSAWFSNGQVTKAVAIGEVAMVHNAQDGLAVAETIRLENFHVLEKVAPNPTFIDQVPSKSGEYTVDLSQISRSQVAFKYQVHLDEATLATHAPVLLTPSWKVEPTQTSIILNYAFNPTFTSQNRSVSLQNVVVIINIENAKAISCQSKPAGTFSKDRNLIYWKLGDVTLDESTTSSQKLLARFKTEGEAKPGSVEARWEIGGESAVGVGSGLGLSREVTDKEKAPDPFADEALAGGNVTSVKVYKEVPVTRKLVSGKYVA